MAVQQWVRGWMVASALVLFGGCATVPEAPPIMVESGMRIGIWVDTGGALTHSHIGTTVFNNFTRAYPEHWDTSPILQEKMEETLRAREFEVVDLRALGFSGKELAGLIRAQGDSWAIDPQRRAVFQRLYQELNLAAVVYAYNPGAYPALTEFTMDGPVPRFAVGPGLHTRGVFGFKATYHAVPGALFEVSWMNPPARLDFSGAMANYAEAQGRSSLMYGEDMDKVRQMTDAEWIPVKQAITSWLRTAAVNVGRRLSE